MARPPTENLTITHDELRRRYVDDDWENTLQAHAGQGRCHTASQPGRGQTIQKTMLKYWEADGTVIALLYRYRRREGDKLVVRMLRYGDVVYSGPQTPGT